MIVERAEIEVAPGKEEAVLALLEEGRDVLNPTNGCKWVKFGRGIENPNKILLLIEWDTLDAHWALVKTPKFQALVEKLNPLTVNRSLEHFDIP